MKPPSAPAEGKGTLVPDQHRDPAPGPDPDRPQLLPKYHLTLTLREELKD